MKPPQNVIIELSISLNCQYIRTELKGFPKQCMGCMSGEAITYSRAAPRKKSVCCLLSGCEATFLSHRLLKLPFFEGK